MSEDQVRRLIDSVRLEDLETEELLKPVFGLSQYPLGMSQNKTNPKMIGVAPPQGDPSDLCASLIASRPLVQLLIPSAKYEGDCREINLNGNRFGKQELPLQFNSSSTTYQSQYPVVTKDNYLLTFTMRYFDTESEIVLDNVMPSFQFYYPRKAYLPINKFASSCRAKPE